MKPTIRYGLILGGILSAIPLILFALGVEKDELLQTITGFLNIAIATVLIFIGIRENRDIQGNGFITFGSGFSSGMGIALIGSAITAFFTYLYFTVINPGMITYIKMKQEEELMKQGLSDEQIEKMAGSMELFSTPIMMTVFSLVGMVLIGLVISLICAGILKKDNPAAQIS